MVEMMWLQFGPDERGCAERPDNSAFAMLFHLPGRGGEACVGIGQVTCQFC